MRRKDRELTNFSDILDIVDRCDIIRLGLADGEYPYIVPVNFSYTANGEELDFYIHGAMAGRKYELMSKLSSCSFEMDIPLQMDCLYDSHDITMRYESVMGTADISFVADEDKQSVIENIVLARYDSTKDFPYSQAALPRTAIVKLHVTSITGKRNPLKSGPDL